MQYRFQTFESISSTMDSVRQQAMSSSCSEGLCVQAYKQETGRGRHGNQWVSEIGNLYMSVLLRPEKSLSAFGQMSFVSALALKDALIAANVPLSAIKIKWPNDILVNNQKIAGLLLEAGIDDAGEDFLILGIGVNIFACPEGRSKLSEYTPDYADRYNNDIESCKQSINQFRDILLESLNKRVQHWHNAPFDDIRSEWIDHAARIGEMITVRFADHSIEGIFETIDRHGALLLKEKSGITRTIQSGEVFF